MSFFLHTIITAINGLKETFILHEGNAFKKGAMTSVKKAVHARLNKVRMTQLNGNDYLFVLEIVEYIFTL